MKREINPIIMGILNVTPDSFSDGGLFLDYKNAIEQATNLIRDGANIIDIGGESTAPGRLSLDSETEFSRIKEVIKDLKNKVTVSVDTFRAGTAEKSLALGASIINDVSALRYDPEMVNVIRDYKAKIILMYSKQSDDLPHADISIKNYDNVINEISEFFDERIHHALKFGISETNIILDTGMGTFISPDAKYSWEVLKKYDEITKRFKNFKFLIATSRKGFLGGDIKERDAISQQTAIHAFRNGASIIRTHNVKMLNEMLKVEEKLSSS